MDGTKFSVYEAKPDKDKTLELLQLPDDIDEVGRDFAELLSTIKVTKHDREYAQYLVGKFKEIGFFAVEN
jgi:hypothetical protein